MASGSARNLLSAFFALCVISGLPGCGAVVGSKELTVVLDRVPPEEETVVLEERVRTEGAPDSSAGFRTWVTGCKIVSCTRSVAVVLHVPRAVNYGFFWWRSTERVRWTFLAPGHVILTLYPTGMVTKTDYTEVHEPTLMWWDRRWRGDFLSATGSATPLEERHLRLRQEYPRDADRATIRLTMRPLVPRREELPPGFDLTPFPALPLGLCESDAWNFAHQISALRRAVNGGRLTDAQGRVAWAVWAASNVSGIIGARLAGPRAGSLATKGNCCAEVLKISPHWQGLEA